MFCGYFCGETEIAGNFADKTCIVTFYCYEEFAVFHIKAGEFNTVSEFIRHSGGFIHTVGGEYPNIGNTAYFIK